MENYPSSVMEQDSPSPTEWSLPAPTTSTPKKEKYMQTKFSLFLPSGKAKSTQMSSNIESPKITSKVASSRKVKMMNPASQNLPFSSQMKK